MAKFPQRLHLGVVDCVRVVIAIHALHICLALVIIEALHVELFGFVQIDGFLVQGSKSGGESHFPDDLRFARGIDHHEVVTGDRPQTHGIGGVAL